MKTLLAVIVVLAIAFGGVAYWRGWFSFENGHVKVNKEKFTKDKDDVKKKAAEKSKAMKDKIANLSKKSEGMSGTEKEKADKEIKELTKKNAELEKKVKELEEADEEKGQEKLDELNKHIDEPSPDTGK